MSAPPIGKTYPPVSYAVGREKIREFAAAIAFLCSEAASFVAGSAWSVDGGVVPGII